MRFLSLVTLFLTLGASAFAAAPSYRYICRLGDYSEKIEVSATTMAMYDQYDGVGRGTRGTVIFDNKGIKTGTGKMTGRLIFSANYDKSQVSPGEITTFYLSPELTTGGLQLRNGSLGGFMTFAGHGYSWESYVCFRAK